MFNHPVKMCCNLDKLLTDINNLRKELIIIAIQEGINSNKTILLSQELDAFILKYQICKDQHI
ncbi:aspartyl-phosphate phosphatase Spo0E family protein [Niallia taxi]|uniref:Spo0E family sporulation regulatory protein-aspartic acid phosphatase n=1 Tax=Niallia taxi TaxID=2499688 RepID=UPI0039823A8F